MEPGAGSIGRLHVLLQGRMYYTDSEGAFSIHPSLGFQGQPLINQMSGTPVGTFQEAERPAGGVFSASGPEVPPPPSLGMF
jgi:hypothetical protein